MTAALAFQAPVKSACFGRLPVTCLPSLGRWVGTTVSYPTDSRAYKHNIRLDNRVERRQGAAVSHGKQTAVTRCASFTCPVLLRCRIAYGRTALK